jgi:uncharacterized protein YecT (DUF1311 family)
MRMSYHTKEQSVSSGLSIRLGIVIGILLLVSCASQPEAEQGRSASAPSIVAPSEWKPSLEQVQEDIEERIAAQPNQSQQALNKASQDLADLVDARLFITYVLLLQQLDEKGRKALFTEQKAWLAQREASARAAVVSKGGSLAPLEYATAFRNLTKKRLAELENRLTQHSTQPGRTPGKGGRSLCN